jgi:hypothetical protein
MKKIVIALLFGVLATSGFTQNNVSVHLSQQYSKFRFLNSSGELDKNYRIDINNAYAINYFYLFDFGLMIRPELSYREAGSVFTGNMQLYKWDLHYANLDIGVGYMYAENDVKPYAGASFFLGYLFKGDQWMGNTYYDLVETESIKKLDLGVDGFIGVMYSFTDRASVFAEFRYTMGLFNLESNPVAGVEQKLCNRAFSAHIGFAFDLNGGKGGALFN